MTNDLSRIERNHHWIFTERWDSSGTFTEPRSMWCPFDFDIRDVSCYETAEHDQSRTLIVLKNGKIFIVRIAFDRFRKLILDNL